MYEGNTYGWKGCCHRCGEKASSHTMSMFNTALICMDCKDKETGRPDYKQAVEADEAAIKSGNFNFKGIGMT